MDLIAVASEGVAIGDDTLKDMHVAGFVFGLEPVERARWLRRIEWTRRIDRIGEAQYLDPSTTPLTNEGWQRLRDRAVEAMSFIGATADDDDAERSGAAEAIGGVGGRKPPNKNDFAIEAFDRYVKATRDYSRPGLTISTVAEFEEMLERLSGSVLHFMPHVPTDLAGEVAALGAVDQLYNEIRDVIEDVECGVCRFPTELFERFGLRKSDFMSGRFDTCEARALFAYLIGDLGPRMRARCARLRASHSLHPTWRRLVSEFDQRHDFVDRVVVESRFDARVFSRSLWERIKSGRVG